jgi:hypothetical protein
VEWNDGTTATATTTTTDHMTVLKILVISYQTNHQIDIILLEGIETVD